MKKLILAGLFSIPALTVPNPSVAKFPMREHTNNAFSFGEKLTYRMHYGIIDAGTGTLEVQPTAVNINGRSTYHVKAEGKSTGSFDWFFKVRDNFETYIDQASIAPLKFANQTDEGGYKNSDFVTFNHDLKKAYSKHGVYTMPAFTQDIISVIYYARTLDMSNAVKGDTFPVIFYFDKQVYNFRMKYLGKEVIKTEMGKIRCLKIQPQLIVDRVFKDADGMTLYITDDANHVPVLVKSELLVGSVRADLSSWANLKNPITCKVD